MSQLTDELRAVRKVFEGKSLALAKLAGERYGRAQGENIRSWCNNFKNSVLGKNSPHAMNDAKMLSDNFISLAVRSLEEDRLELFHKACSYASSSPALAEHHLSIASASLDHEGAVGHLDEADKAFRIISGERQVESGFTNLADAAIRNRYSPALLASVRESFEEFAGIHTDLYEFTSLSREVLEGVINKIPEEKLLEIMAQARKWHSKASEGINENERMGKKVSGYDVNNMMVDRVKGAIRKEITHMQMTRNILK